MLRYGFFLIVILYYVRETFILMKNPKFVGFVVVDEISITSDLYFNATLLQFEGFADHLCDLPQGNNDEQFKDLATNFMLTTHWFSCSGLSWGLGYSQLRFFLPKMLYRVPHCIKLLGRELCYLKTQERK